MNTELVRKALEIGLDIAGQFAAQHPAWAETTLKEADTIRQALAELDRAEAKPPGMGGISPCGGCELEWCEGCKWERKRKEARP